MAETQKRPPRQVAISLLARPVVNFGVELIEEARAWVSASPRPLNRIDEASVNRFFETGPDLIEALVGAIGCGQHVALAGPRGCGKSYCIGQAIKLAEQRGLIPRNGSVKIQGNKELPRDYLLEDDMTLTVDGKTVIPKRKDAPLFRFARRSDDPKHPGRPMKKEGDSKLVDCYGVNENNELLEDEPIQDHQRIVLFLDEVNRFSDGVLDSLLLLLEEGEVVMSGETFKLPVVVMMTMNPPGYDASARSLSPPLSARIGRQYRLLSPRLDVLTDLIAPEVIHALTERTQGAVSEGVTLKPPSVHLVRRAAAATLCAWGDPRSHNPGFDYLSGEMRALIQGLADTSQALRGAMETLNELCNFGPDGRALGDWIVAASVAAANEATALKRDAAEPFPEHFISVAVTVLSHKLQDNFSSASRPDNTRRKEEALYVIASTILRSRSAELDKLLWRAVDDEGALLEALRTFIPRVDPEYARAAFIEFGLTDSVDIERWEEVLTLIASHKRDVMSSDEATEMVRDDLLHTGILEREGDETAFASEANRKALRWLSSQINGKSQGPLHSAMSEIAAGTKAQAEAIEKILDHFGFVSAGVWVEYANLRLLIRDETLISLSRKEILALFEALDAVWVNAEHLGAASIEPLWALLTDEDEAASINEFQRQPARQFALRTLERIARHPDRGGGARAAKRALVARLRAAQMPDIVSSIGAERHGVIAPANGDSGQQAGGTGAGHA